MKEITVEENQIWTKLADHYGEVENKMPQNKLKARVYTVVNIFRDEIDTIAILRNFKTQGVKAIDVREMLGNSSWKYHPNASVTWRQVADIEWDESSYTRDKPKKKYKPKKKAEPKKEVKVSLDISKTVKEITGNRDTQIAKALNGAVEKADKKKSKKIPTDQESWERFSSYMYEDLGTFGEIFKDTEVLSDPNYRGRWMNGRYALQGQQCLDMYRDEGVTIRRILSKQLVETYEGSGIWKPLSYQAIIKRLFKAIWKHGKPEERKLLFGDLYKGGK